MGGVGGVGGVDGVVFVSKPTLAEVGLGFKTKSWTRLLHIIMTSNMANIVIFLNSIKMEITSKNR